MELSSFGYLPGWRERTPQADRACLAAFPLLDIESAKNYREVVALIVRASSQNANSPMTVLKLLLKLLPDNRSARVLTVPDWATLLATN